MTKDELINLAVAVGVCASTVLYAALYAVLMTTAGLGD